LVGINRPGLEKCPSAAVLTAASFYDKNTQLVRILKSGNVGETPALPKKICQKKS
jgi:hypothetical protein